MAIPLGFYLLWKKRINPFKGLFSIPLAGHLSVITLSSILFLRVKEQFRRLIEQDFFSLTYFVGFVFSKEKAERFLKYLIYFSIFAGIILSAKVIYSYFVLHNYKGFWGGNFVVGNLLAVPFFGSLYLFFNTKSLFKVIFLTFAGLFIFASFLSVERSVILGYLIGLTIFLYGLVKFYRLKRIWILTLLGIFILIGGFAAVKNPKIQHWYQLLKKQEFNEKIINTFSSGRITIAKGALELVENAIKQEDYLKLLIGWGYGPQKQYNNLPKGLRFINEYESFVFLTEFINGGLLNLVFIIWFYISAIILTIGIFKSKMQQTFLLSLAIVSAIWVNLGYHLFTLFWVPINALFYTLMVLLEKMSRTK